jgi:hypothetical protein
MDAISSMGSVFIKASRQAISKTDPAGKGYVTVAKFKKDAMNK